MAANSEPKRAGTTMAMRTVDVEKLNNTDYTDPFYKRAHYNDLPQTPQTVASSGQNHMTAQGKENDEVLNHIHKMRVKMFEERAAKSINFKPNLPQLSSDEKELIMEQYFASKKKLNKGL